jgi:hypothetical protein
MMSALTLLYVLLAVALGFLAIFHLTPIGIPGMRRLGDLVLLDLSFGYSPDRAYRELARYGAAGIRHFRHMLYLDFVFPAVYGALGAVGTVLVTRTAGIGSLAADLLLAAPIAAAACDYVENVLLLAVIRDLPRRHDAAVRLASLATQGKFLLCLATVLGLLACGIGAWLG